MKHLIPLSFSAALLKSGNNTIALNMTNVSSGGGALYDFLKLEVG